MTEPGDEKTAATGGRSRLQASHADREQAIEVLKAAYIQERLTKGELVTRVGQAFASQTYGTRRGHRLPRATGHRGVPTAKSRLTGGGPLVR